MRHSEFLRAIVIVADESSTSQGRIQGPIATSRFDSLNLEAPVKLYYTASLDHPVAAANIHRPSGQAKLGTTRLAAFTANRGTKRRLTA